MQIFDELADGCISAAFAGIAYVLLLPFVFLFWTTGVAVCTALSLGRFQLEPFIEDLDWNPEDGRPILYSDAATGAGVVIWTIFLLIIFRNSIF